MYNNLLTNLFLHFVPDLGSKRVILINIIRIIGGYFDIPIFNICVNYWIKPNNYQKYLENKMDVSPDRAVKNITHDATCMSAAVVGNSDFICKLLNLTLFRSFRTRRNPKQFSKN